MPVKRSFRRILSRVLCYHLDQDDHSETQPSSMRELQPNSPGSTIVPSSTGQRDSAGNLQITDRQALHDIFHSSSSVRGYRAANTSLLAHSCSLDSRPLTQHSPTKKTGGRLEQVGQNMRKRISASRLSQSSSKIMVRKDGYGPSALGLDKKQDESRLLGISHQSTGLSDILMSRTVSQGGYDSDAKSVELAGLRSTTGTIRIGPEQSKKRLNSAASGLREEMLAPAELHAAVQTVENTGTHCQRSSISSSSPTDPVVTRTASPIEDRSTLEKKPFNSAVRRSQGLQCASNQTVDTAQAKGTGSHDSALPDQTSAEHQGLDESLLTVGPQTLRYIGAISQHSLESLPPGKSKTAHEDDALPEFGAILRAANSIDRSDSDSVHLFNMRISQRLASTSQIPVLAASHSTSAASTSDDRPESDKLRSYRSSMIRFPSWIAQEHNRRPSDPQTKRLFEGNPDDNHNKLYTKWKSITSIGSNAAPASTQASREDASSFYWSDNELPGSSAGSAVNVDRKSSLKNPNSIAIGGRSASCTLPRESSSKLSIGDVDNESNRRSAGPQKSSADSSSMLTSSVRASDTRGRSMPKESRFAEVLGTPTHRPQRHSSTKIKEGTSSEDHHVRRNETLSEISVEHAADARREHMSEIDPQSVPLPHNLTRGRKISIGWLSQGRRSGWGFDFIDRSPSRQRRGDASFRGSEHELQESATNMWERALRRARDRESASESGFLGLPQFDRTGRRKRSSTTVGNGESLRGRRLTVPRDHERSRSEDRDGCSLMENRHKICAIAKEPLTNAVSRPEDAEKSTTKFGSQRQGAKLRKKSLLDVRRLTAIGASSHDASGTTTPVRELSSWTRFPSYARAERTGTAGDNDGVISRDFEHEVDEASSSINVSTTNLGLHTPGGRFESLKNAFSSKNSSSGSILRLKPLNSTMSRTGPKRRLTGLWGWKKLSRHASSGLQRHQSCFDVSTAVAYSDLKASDKIVVEREPESTPWRTRNEPRKSGSWDYGDIRIQPDSCSEEHLGVGTSRCSSAASHLTRQPSQAKPSQAKSRPSAELLARQYQDAVLAPFPPPNSEADRHDEETNRKGHRRNSTDNTNPDAFREELHKRQADNKARLLQRIGSIDKHGDVGNTDDELQMPPALPAAECEIGQTLGKKGSCEDVAGREVGGVDGA